jgi:hypothetical protein
MLLARLDPSILTAYALRGSSGSWNLFRVVNGVFTSLGSSAQAWTVGSTYRAVLRVRGTQVTALVDGVERITVADANISAAGQVGTRSSVAQTDTTGLHLDNLLAEDPVVIDTTPPITTLGTPTRTTISRVPPYDFSDVTIAANEPFVEYMLRRVPAETSTRIEGGLIETAVVAATTSLTATITDDELVAAGATEGPNWVKGFTKDSAGNWST